MNTFEFYRFRFHFRVLEPVRFPPGKSANILRGALGIQLLESASPDDYRRLFAPEGAGPSGLADRPRPFVFRTAHLDGVAFSPGSDFHFDLHIFDLVPTTFQQFRRAFGQLAESGLGPGRGRVALARVDQLDLADRASPIGDTPRPPCVIALEPDPTPISRVTVSFLTPTELKSGGTLAAKPEFPVLFGRLRDRLSTLRALYGAGPLEIDFRAIGDRASAVRLIESELRWESLERKSSRTGQVHPLGGFTGTAVYEGELAEFLPWLRAARWTGVGRQTTWGKGELRFSTRDPLGRS